MSQIEQAPKGYITVNEAAKRLGRSTEQVRRYLREGKVEGQRMGGQWFIAETTTLYRTRRERTGMYLEAERDYRIDVISRIDRRREEIKRRWEEKGVVFDVVGLLEEMREERP